MKYLKTFEINTTQTYNVGDYILYKCYTDDDYNEYLAYIYDIHKTDFSVYPYKIKYVDKNENKIYDDITNILYIIRNLNSDEIEEYEVISNTIKYNL